MLVARPQSSEAIVIRHVHFEGKVVANEYELSENNVVARQPGSDNQDSGQNAYDCSSETAGITRQVIEQPEQAERKHGEHCGVRQCNHTPQQPENYPIPLARWLVCHAHCQQQSQAQQKCGQTSFPDDASWPINSVGEEGPSPGGGASHGESIHSLRDPVQRKTCQRGKDAIESKNYPGCRMAINSE